MSTQIEKLVSERENKFQILEALIAGAEDENRDFSEAEQANERSISAEIERLSKRIDSLKSIEARRAVDAELTVRSGNTARTSISDGEIYRADGEHNFFADLAKSTIAKDRDAQYRLDAHNELARATVTGDLAGLVLPKYEVDLLAKFTSEGRPFANTLTQRPLNNNTVSIAKQTSGTRVEVQASQGTAPSLATDFETTEIVLTASTVHGFAQASVQALDFGSLDTAGIRDDLFRTYNEAINTQVIFGSGTGGNIKGAVTALGSTAKTSVDTAEELWDLAGEAKTEIYKATNQAATHVFMTPDVWQVISQQLDSEGRPVYGWSNSAPTNVTGQGMTWNGLNVVIDSSLYRGSQDATPVYSTYFVVGKANEGLLYEQGPKTITLDQVHARNGLVEFVVRGYATATFERRPGAFEIFTVANPS